MVKVAVLVSGGGTNLQAILDAQANGTIKSGEVALVVSSRAGVFALERAANAGVKTAVLPRKGFATGAEYDEALAALLKENGIQFVVLAGFLSILGPAFIKAFENRIINVHPSLIPAFCGAGFYGLKVHEAALAYGVKVSGATVHVVNEIPDGGRILAQKAVEVLETDTPEALQQRIMEQAEWQLLPAAVESCCKEILAGKR